jgi:hypothetical protein
MLPQLPVSNTGPVQRMDPLNKLQVAVKTTADVLYFDCMVPDYVLLADDGLMERSVFLDVCVNLFGKSVELPGPRKCGLKVGCFSPERMWFG